MKKKTKKSQLFGLIYTSKGAAQSLFCISRCRRTSQIKSQLPVFRSVKMNDSSEASEMCSTQMSLQFTHEFLQTCTHRSCLHSEDQPQLFQGVAVATSADRLGDVHDVLAIFPYPNDVYFNLPLSSSKLCSVLKHSEIAS